MQTISSKPYIERTELGSFSLSKVKISKAEKDFDSLLSIFGDHIDHHVNKTVSLLMEQEEVIVERRKPRKGRRPPRTKRFNIRPMISELALEDTSSVEVSFVTTRSEERLAKWREVAELIGLDPQSIRVMKHQTQLRSHTKEA